MNVAVAGIGLWGPGLMSFAEFVAAQQAGFAHLQGAAFSTPTPAAIPARERRRAGLAINLAVEVAHQACDAAGADKSTIPSVFTSTLGDSAITDYMCRKLAGEEKLLSPTKFHNSVNNAPSGYWTISAVNRAPSTFVGGFGHAFGVGLLEAASQAVAFEGPVLLVGSDVANGPPLDDVVDIRASLGVAFVIEPAKGENASVRFLAEEAPGAEPTDARLAALARANPMGCALALVEACAGGGSKAAALRFPVSPHACVEWRQGGGGN